VDIGLVSKILGHGSIAITADAYSHLLDGVGREAAERRPKVDGGHNDCRTLLRTRIERPTLPLMVCHRIHGVCFGQPPS
jgi:hypothetical protein